jgi:O-antigen/teichoic acid export membrane protein
MTMGFATIELTRWQIIRRVTDLFTGSAAAQGFTAIALLLTARQLGAVVYGQFAASLALASVTAIIFNLGLDLWLLREGGRNGSRIGQLTGSVFIIKIVVGALWFIAMNSMLFILTLDVFPAYLFLWCAISVWLDSTFNTLLTALKAILHTRTASILEAGSDALWLLGTVALIGIGSIDPVAFFQIRIGALIISIVISGILTWKLILPLFSFSVVRRALRDSYPYAASELLAWATMRADVLIVSLTLGSYAVGLYSPIVGLINASYLLPNAAYLVFVPVLSSLYANHFGKAKSFGKKAVILLFGLGVLLSIGMFIVSPHLISILGDDYQESLILLQILSVILVFKSGSFAMASILVASGNQGKRPIIQAIAVSFNITANIIVIPIFGIIGVAVVYILTEVLILMGYTFFAKKTFTALTLPNQ